MRRFLTVPMVILTVLTLTILLLPAQGKAAVEPDIGKITIPMNAINERQAIGFKALTSWIITATRKADLTTKSVLLGTFPSGAALDDYMLSNSQLKAVINSFRSHIESIYRSFYKDESRDEIWPNFATLYQQAMGTTGSGPGQDTWANSSILPTEQDFDEVVNLLNKLLYPVELIVGAAMSNSTQGNMVNHSDYDSWIDAATDSWSLCLASSPGGSGGDRLIRSDQIISGYPNFGWVQSRHWYDGMGKLTDRTCAYYNADYVDRIRLKVTPTYVLRVKSFIDGPMEYLPLQIDFVAVDSAVSWSTSHTFGAWQTTPEYFDFPIIPNSSTPGKKFDDVSVRCNGLNHAQQPVTDIIGAPNYPGCIQVFDELQASLNFSLIFYGRTATPVEFLKPEWRYGYGCDYPSIVIGSSVNLANGNLFDDIDLITTSGTGLTTNITACYNSKDTYTGPLGPGWTHNYNINLTESGDSITLMDEDATRLKFLDEDADGVYTAESKFGDHSTLVKNPDGTYLLTRKYGTKHYFNHSGKLTRIEDRNGNTQTFTSTTGNLTQITDPAGRITAIEYIPENRIAKITDPTNRITEFYYDTAGNLTQIKDPAGNSHIYTYNEQNKLSSKQDPEGNLYTYTYNEEGKLIGATDPDNNITSIQYDPDNNRAIITDPLNNESIYDYNRDLNVWTQIQDPLGNTVSKTWDGNRNDLTTTDANGNTSTNTYDEKGNLLTSTDAAGNQTEYTYEPVYNQILTQTDALNNATAYEYDTKGNRTGTTDALNQTTQYAYDEKGRLLSSTDPRGNTSANTYNEAGNLITSTDALGNTTAYTYDTAGNLATTTDPQDNTTSYENNNLNQLIAVTDAAGNRTEYTYDANGNRTSVTDPQGNITQYEYDNQNRLIKVIDGRGNIIQYTYDANDNRIETKDPEGNITTYAYDKAGRLIAGTDPQGAVTQYTYDPAGNRTSVTDAQGSQTRYTYSNLNQITQITDAQDNITAYTYDAKGRKTGITDTRGATTYSYDSLDRTISVTDPQGNETGFAYDEVGNRTSITDSLGRTIRFEYDALGRITAATDPQGNTTRSEYDSRGNLIAVTDAQGNRTQYEYNTLNRIIAMIDPQGGRTTYEYDTRGNRISITDPQGRTIRFEYDENNRVIAAIDPQGNKTEYQYDKRGNKIAAQGPLGRITRYEYNKLNQLTAIIDPSGARAEFTYDSRGNLATKTDPNRNTVRYKYNVLNQLIKRIYPDGYTDTWTYDAQGNELTKDSPSVHIENQYDVLNRLISRRVASKANGRLLPAKTITYTYDALGNRLSMTDPHGGATTYTYDERSQLTRLINPDDEETTLKYDSLGQRAKLTRADGSRTVYTYDTRSQLTELINYATKGDQISWYAYEYNSSGNRTRVQERDGVWTYSYDEKDHLIKAAFVPVERHKTKEKQKDNKGKKDNDQDNNDSNDKGSLIFTYIYDSAGNRISLSVETEAPDQALKIKEYTPTLDKQPKLKHPITVTYTYNQADQLIKEIAAREEIGQGKREYETTYIYDANGNLISKTILKGNKGKDEHITGYEYDYENMVTKITYPDGEENIFHNCTCGTKRVYKKDSTGITTYFFDEQGNTEHVLFEYDETGQIKTRYTLGPRVDEIISKKYLTEEGEWKTVYYLYDGLGSVRQLVDEKGKVVAEYDYSPFGQIINAQGSQAKKNDYTYTGRNYDRDSGFYYYRTRYMDARQGRFTSWDTILRRPSLNGWSSQSVSPGSCLTCGGGSSNYSSIAPVPTSSTSLAHQHPYNYCSNNPINNIDPTGEVVVIVHGIVNPLTQIPVSSGYSNQFQTLLNQYITAYGGQPEQFVEVQWDGDAYGYGIDPTNALTRFINGLQRAKQMQPNVNCRHVVAHSWGTVLSYQAWAGGHHSPYAPTTNIRVNNYFTMGSPWNSTLTGPWWGNTTLSDFTRVRTSIYGALSKPSEVKGTWWNFWSHGDPISASIPAARNLQPAGGHSSYWSNPIALSTIAWQITH